MVIVIVIIAIVIVIAVIVIIIIIVIISPLDASQVAPTNSLPSSLSSASCKACPQVHVNVTFRFQKTVNYEFATLALVVLRLDNAIPQINHYPVDKC